MFNPSRLPKLQAPKLQAMWTPSRSPLLRDDFYVPAIQLDREQITQKDFIAQPSTVLHYAIMVLRVHQDFSDLAIFTNEKTIQCHSASFNVLVQCLKSQQQDRDSKRITASCSQGFLSWLATSPISAPK